LRPGNTRYRRDRDSAGCEMQKISARKLHDVAP
jgi:hypothetical protein